MDVWCCNCKHWGLRDLGNEYSEITCDVDGYNGDGKCDKYIELDWSDMFTAEDFEESKLINLDDEDEIPF